MGPIGHTVISAGVGAGVWGITGSPAAAGTALGVGVFTDIDHLFDYYQWYVRRKTNRVFLIFHAWEYGIAGAVVLATLYYHPLLFGAVLAHLGHVACDHFHNGMAPWGYSISYRVLIGFSRKRVAPYHNVLRSFESWLHMIPFGERLEPWYQRKIEPWFKSRIDI